MYYTVNDQIFTNKFHAAAEAIKTGHEIKFNLFDDAFSAADWSKEPELTWNQLLDIRANQIAAKNKPIVLNFSGGTDSYTIYKVFERNNIHIDLLFLRRRKTDVDTKINEKVLELLNNGIYDKTTKILIREDDSSHFSSAYDSEDWIWNKNIKIQFAWGFNSDWNSEEYIAKELGTDDYISVSGFDKPRLIFNDFGVHSYQQDYVFDKSMGLKTIDPFFINPELPELHIKQSYMMLNYIRSKEPYATPRDLKKYNDFWDPVKSNHDEYALACGRFGDLSMSGFVHAAWQKQQLIIPSSGKFNDIKHVGPGQNWFDSLSGSKTISNYTRGIMNLFNDPVGKYLITDPTNAYKLKPVGSKPYKLTFIIDKKPA